MRFTAVGRFVSSLFIGRLHAFERRRRGCASRQTAKIARAHIEFVAITSISADNMWPAYSNVTPIFVSVRHTERQRWRTPSIMTSKCVGMPNVVDT